MAIDGSAEIFSGALPRTSETTPLTRTRERLHRLQRYTRECITIGTTLLGLKSEELKFKLDHNLWNAPGYFHTGPDERYFYTVFKQELLHLREEQISDPHIKKRIQDYQHKLSNRTQEMGTVHPHDKVRLKEDAQYLAKLYEESRLFGGEAGIRFRDEMRKIRMLGGQYRAPVIEH